MLYTLSSFRLAHVRSAFFSANAFCGPSSATAAIVQLWAAARRGGAGKGGGDRGQGERVHMALCRHLGSWLAACLPGEGGRGTTTITTTTTSACSGARPPPRTRDGGGAGGKDDAGVGRAAELDGRAEVALAHRLHVVVGCEGVSARVQACKCVSVSGPGAGEAVCADAERAGSCDASQPDGRMTTPPAAPHPPHPRRRAHAPHTAHL